MTINVELKPDVEARLIAEARSRGVPVEKVAESLLREALAARSTLQEILSVEEFHSMLSAMAAGSESLPDLPTDTFSRESYYQDRP